MKKILSLFIILYLGISVYAGDNSDFKQFYRQHKRDKGVINFWVPPFILRVASINQDAYIQNFAHSTSNVRIMIKEESAEYLYYELNSSLPDETYKDLLFVKDGKNDVRITAHIKKDKIKEILIIVNDSSNFVAIQLKGNYRINDLAGLVKEIS